MSRKMLKYWMLLLALALVLAACGGGDTADEPADTEDTAADTTEDTAVSEDTADSEEPMEEEMSDEVITLEFWHAMADDLGAVVDELVTRFNDSQDGIVVNATYQGSYDDTYNALLAAFETGTEPNIIQNFDLASQTMIDTGRLVAAHDLMAADGYDSSVFVPAVADYYGDG